MFVFGDCWRCIRKASANKNKNKFFKVRPCDFLKLKTLPSARPKLLHPCTESLVIFCNKNRKKHQLGFIDTAKGFYVSPANRHASSSLLPSFFYFPYPVGCSLSLVYLPSKFLELFLGI